MELVSEIDISALKGEHRLMVGTMLSTGRIIAEVTELYLK